MAPKLMKVQQRKQKGVLMTLESQLGKPFLAILETDLLTLKAAKVSFMLSLDRVK